MYAWQLEVCCRDAYAPMAAHGAGPAGGGGTGGTEGGAGGGGGGGGTAGGFAWAKHSLSESLVNSPLHV